MIQLQAAALDPAAAAARKWEGQLADWNMRHLCGAVTSVVLKRSSTPTTLTLDCATCRLKRWTQQQLPAAGRAAGRQSMLPRPQSTDMR